MYSVGLYEITCEQNILLMNSKNVTGNSTRNSIDPMQIYSVTVAARNNVEGARNGPSVDIKGIRSKNLLILPDDKTCFSYLILI